MKKLATNWAEFWLINGNLINVRNFPGSHSGYVIKHILDKYHIKSPERYISSSYINDSDLEKLKKRNISPAELEVLMGTLNGIDFAVNNWGWVRISYNTVQLPNLSSSLLQQSADALLQIYGDESRKNSFNIISGDNDYDKVPFENLEYGDVRAVKNSAYVYAGIKGKFIKLAQVDMWGQYWVINGNPVDVGDFTHTHNDYIINHILQKNKISDTGIHLNSWGEIEGIDKYEREYLAQNLSADELGVLTGDIDPIDYGVDILGWIRISTGILHLPNLSSTTLQQAANALLQIYGDGIKKLEHFYIVCKRKDYDNVSFETLENGDLRTLSDSRALYAQRRKNMNKKVIIAELNECANYLDGIYQLELADELTKIATRVAEDINEDLDLFDYLDDPKQKIINYKIVRDEEGYKGDDGRWIPISPKDAQAAINKLEKEIEGEELENKSGSICLQCGSPDVDIDAVNGKGNCRSCGAQFIFGTSIEEIY